MSIISVEGTDPQPVRADGKHDARVSTDGHTVDLAMNALPVNETPDPLVATFTAAQFEDMAASMLWKSWGQNVQRDSLMHADWKLQQSADTRDEWDYTKLKIDLVLDGGGDGPDIVNATFPIEGINRIRLHCVEQMGKDVAGRDAERIAQSDRTAYRVTGSASPSPTKPNTLLNGSFPSRPVPSTHHSSAAAQPCTPPHRSGPGKGISR